MQAGPAPHSLAALLAATLLGAVPAAAAKDTQKQAPGLRQLSGNVGTIGRGEDGAEPLPRYLDRLEATLWLEQARMTAGPYVVSVANSLEALSPEERAGRGERLLLSAYVLLSGFSGPQGGRLMHLYAVGLAQLVGATPDEVTVSPALRDELRRIGAYAARAAGRMLARPAAAPPQERVQLLLAQGQYAAAAQQARALSKEGALGRASLLGAQLLGGQAAAAAPLREIEREGGPAGQVAWNLLRRAAREALVARLGRSLTAASVPAELRKAATAWGRPEDPPLREACQLLLQQSPPGGAEAALGDCLALLLESPGSDWARHPALEQAPPDASDETALQDPRARRLALLRLAAQLGALLGLPGQRPAAEAGVRTRALQEVTRLLPAAALPAEEAEALMLLAQIGAAQRPDVPQHLHPAIDKFLRAHPCSPLGLPLLLGRRAPAERPRALAEALDRCTAADARASEARRTLALQLLSADPLGPAAAGAYQVLEQLAAEAGKAPGGGRFLLSLADGAALRLLSARGTEPDDTQLAALQGRYEEAAAALSPWDGAEARGRAEVQVAALLYRRHLRKPDGALLEAARSRLRYAMLLSGEDALIAQALEDAVAREAALLRKEAVKAPQDDLGTLPAGLGRRVLACVLAQRARAAKDQAAAARHGALGGAEPLPAVAALGQVRLTTSLGVDERLRVGTRGELAVSILPRCAR